MAKRKSTLKRVGDTVKGAAKSVAEALGMGGKKKSGAKKGGAKKGASKKGGAKRATAKR
jgi:hypothetical protein